MRQRRTGGFTLIEVLVVMSIMGVLATLGLSNYITSQKRGRDAKRFADLKSIAEAQEQNFGEYGTYQLIGNATSEAESDCVIPADFMEFVPTDPQDSVSGYQCAHPYSGSLLEDAYCVSVELEVSNGNCAGCDCDNTDDCGFNSSGTTHYCVKNQQ